MLKLAAVDYTQCKTCPGRAACCCCSMLDARREPAGRRFHLTGGKHERRSQSATPPHGLPLAANSQTFNSLRLNHSSRPRGNGWMHGGASNGLAILWCSNFTTVTGGGRKRLLLFFHSVRVSSSDGQASGQAFAGESEEE